MAAKQPEHPSIRQSKEALLEAAQAAIADQRTRPPDNGPLRMPPEEHGVFFPATMGVLIVAAALLLVLQPTWLAGPKFPPESEAVRAASATLSLVDAMSKVRAYFDVRGHLPPKLEDAGIDNRSIRFKVFDRTVFEISVPAGDSLISLRSTDSLKPRVVDAILALQRRT